MIVWDLLLKLYDETLEYVYRHCFLIEFFIFICKVFPFKSLHIFNKHRHKLYFILCKELVFYLYNQARLSEKEIRIDATHKLKFPYIKSYRFTHKKFANNNFFFFFLCFLIAFYLKILAEIFTCVCVFL